MKNDNCIYLQCNCITVSNSYNVNYSQLENQLTNNIDDKFSDIEKKLDTLIAQLYSVNYVDYGTKIRLNADTTYVAPFDLIIVYRGAATPYLYYGEYNDTTIRFDNIAASREMAGESSITKFHIPVDTTFWFNSDTMPYGTFLPLNANETTDDTKYTIIANKSYADILSESSISQFFNVFKFIGKLTFSTAFEEITDYTKKYYAIDLQYQLKNINTQFIKVNQSYNKISTLTQIQKFTGFLTYSSSIKHINLFKTGSSGGSYVKLMSLSEMTPDIQNLTIKMFNFGV